MTSFIDVPCEKTQLLFYEIFFTFELNESVSYNEQWSGLIRPTWWGSNESLPQICCCCCWSATYHILLAYIIIMCIPNFALQCPPGVCPISVISPLSCWIPYSLVTSLIFSLVCKINESNFQTISNFNKLFLYFSLLLRFSTKYSL